MRFECIKKPSEFTNAQLNYQWSITTVKVVVDVLAQGVLALKLKLRPPFFFSFTIHPSKMCTSWLWANERTSLRNMPYQNKNFFLDVHKCNFKVGDCIASLLTMSMTILSYLFDYSAPPTLIENSMPSITMHAPIPVTSSSQEKVITGLK